MALRDTSSECGLLVKAMRQFTQSVNVVVSVSAGQQADQDSMVTAT